VSINGVNDDVDATVVDISYQSLYCACSAVKAACQTYAGVIASAAAAFAPATRITTALNSWQHGKPYPSSAAAVINLVANITSTSRIFIPSFCAL